MCSLGTKKERRGLCHWHALGCRVYRILPRRMFGDLQSRMRPAYFAAVGACSAISLASFGHLHPWSSASTTEKYRLGFLTSSFVLHLDNLVLFNPLTIQVICCVPHSLLLLLLESTGNPTGALCSCLRTYGSSNFQATQPLRKKRTFKCHRSFGETGRG